MLASNDVILCFFWHFGGILRGYHISDYMTLLLKNHLYSVFKILRITLIKYSAVMTEMYQVNELFGTA